MNFFGYVLFAWYMFSFTSLFSIQNVDDVSHNSKNFVRLFNAIHKKDPALFFKDFKEISQRYRSQKKKLKELLMEQDDQGWTLFFHAVEIGDLHRLSFLLEQIKNFFGNDLASYLQIVNVQDVHGRTPLFIAAERRAIPIVNLLLSQVKQVLAKDKKYFFDFLNTSENHMNWTPLMVATYDSASRIIELIVQAADEVLGRNSPYYQTFINARGSFGRGATTLAIDPRDRWLLLDYGARDTAELEDPQTVELKAIGAELLRLALNDGNEEKMKKLFENFNTRYKDNYQAFLYILTARDEGGWTALMNAASDGNVDYITQILTTAADFFKKDVVTALLKKGIVRDDTVWVSILLNNADVHGRTALHLAIARRHLPAIKKLLELHEKIFGNDRRTFNRFMNNRTELNGFTPLLLAAYVSSDDERSYEIIKTLVERARTVFKKDSVDYERFMNAADLDGQTALAYVVSPRIRAYLKAHGAR